MKEIKHYFMSCICSSSHYYLCRLTMRRNQLTMWLHPYGIMNSCLLFKGTDQVGHLNLAANMMNETVAFDSLFYVRVTLVNTGLFQITCSSSHYYLCRLTMRRNQLTMWLHSYGIVNSCLLFKGTEQVGHLI